MIRPLTFIPRLFAAASLVVCAGGTVRADGVPVTMRTDRGSESILLGSPDLKHSTGRRTLGAGASEAVEATARVIVEFAPGGLLMRAVDAAAIGVVAQSQPIMISEARGFARIECASVRAAGALAQKLSTHPRVRRVYVDVRTARAQKSLPTDPLFAQQWHLRNLVTPAADINVEPAWNAGLTGAGVTVGIVDFGVSTTHPDLLANFNAAASQPIPASQRDGHSTSCAGLVAAAANNGIGVAGVAFGAKWSNLTFGVSSADEAVALGFRNDLNFVKSNSWGPFDNGQISYLDPMTRTAMEQAATSGRGGLGTVIVWAAGNGGAIDRVDYDPFASSRFALAVSAVGDTNTIPAYAEPGSCILGVAPSDGNVRLISTTDFNGSNTYTSNFGGTSASAPIGAGVVALMLQANPALTYRDVQHVLIGSAVQINPLDAGWSTNGAQHRYHERMGFGLLDAGRATAIAAAYPGVGPEVSASSGVIAVNVAVPDGVFAPGGLSRSAVISDQFRVEHVEVTLNVACAFIGQLRISLTSPLGTVCTLAEPRFDPHSGYNGYVVTIKKLWDEPSAGTWTILISDEVGGTATTWTDFTLSVFGNRHCPADLTDVGGPPLKPDGQLTVDDIIAMVNAYMDESLLADVAHVGGGIGPDGELTVDDLMFFVNGFMDGCP